MKEKYYYSKTIRTFVSLTPLFFLLPFIFLFITQGLPVPIILAAVLINLPLLFLIKKINEPAVEITDEGILLKASFLSKETSVKWNEIAGMASFRMQGAEILKIHKKTIGSSLVLFNVGLKALQKPDELSRILRDKIPLNKSIDIKQPVKFARSHTNKEIKHRDLTLSENGISKAGATIPWDKIIEIACAPTGLPYISVTYAEHGKKNEPIIIKPPFASTAKNTAKYYEFILYLIQHSHEANLDPGLAKILNTPVKEASSDQWCVVLMICGFIITGVVSFILMYYAPFPETALRTLFAFLVLTVCLIPVLRTLFLLKSQAGGRDIDGAKKTKWSYLCVITAPLVFVLACIVFPFSSFYMMGDLNLKTGNLDKAEHFYLKALQKCPDNVDVSFDLGILHKEKGNYEAAFEYFKKAYLKDPTYWLADAAAEIPDTLILMKRYEDALAWCKKIIHDNSKDPSFKKILGNKINTINHLLENKS